MAKQDGLSVEVGVFGGSGFYSLLEDAHEYQVSTPYGQPSDLVMVGEIEGRSVAFLPRHGRFHQYPPHTINYLANIWAMHELGVTRIIAPGACGSLQPDIAPGNFVLCDQFVDRTKNRWQTFYNGPLTTHISVDEPYCPELRELAAQAAFKLDITCRDEGTAVIIQGPRFSTKAESIWYTRMGWSVVNMTQYPEVTLARELEICYLNISLVTDWDVGVSGMPGVEPVTADGIQRVFQENNERLRNLLYAMIPFIPPGRSCVCSQALKGAVINPVATPQ